MSYDRAGDEELMAQVARGNREAMNPLVRRHASSLLTFIRRMVGDWHRAEELFQEAFLAVWQHRRRYQYPRPFRSWLFGIAMNKCRADFRKCLPMPATLVAGADHVAIAVGSSPVEAAITTETATIVAAAVATLPPMQRAVLVLRVWNHQEYYEIATACDITEGTARSQMCHALAAMRRHLEPRLRQAKD
jgi:RNA polymerase sigma-70 factor (ECF subfamily)